MNYKDPENIFVIACGSAGVAALAVIIRQLFVGFGFDSFSANIVFIIVFVVGVIVFINYLEFIQKLTVRLFKKKQPLTEESNIEVVELIEKSKPDLDSIREEHKQKEEQRKEELLKDAIQYTRTTFAPYATDDNIDLLCDYITDYYNGIKFENDIKSVIVKELSNGDLFHFGWNIWNHFKPLRNSKQYEISYFIKAVFAKQLKDVDTDTIRKKLTFDEGKFEIELKKIMFNPED